MALEIVDDQPVPVHELRYLNARRGGGTTVARLVIAQARVRGLPRSLDALVATSDLQGIVPAPHTREAQLLGVAVADALGALADDGALPDPARSGVILAGDLYSVPGADERGGHGDVAPVWAAFAERFAWVVGVAGNHDDTSQVEAAPHVHLLDCEQRALDGLRFGGVGLIAGNPAKRGRRDEDEQLARIELSADGVDVLVLHEGPAGDGAHQRGHPRIRRVVEDARVPLTICGHDGWDPPLARLPRGQILNVDARVVILVPDDRGP